jgi:hypothetical protein
MSKGHLRRGEMRYDEVRQYRICEHFSFLSTSTWCIGLVTLHLGNGYISRPLSPCSLCCILPARCFLDPLPSLPLLPPLPICRASYYCLTMCKGGWDTMRHNEILANGCVPYFLDIEHLPRSTMAVFPRVRRARAGETEGREGGRDRGKGRVARYKAGGDVIGVRSG